MQTPEPGADTGETPCVHCFVPRFVLRVVIQETVPRRTLTIRGPRSRCEIQWRIMMRSSDPQSECDDRLQ